MVLLIGTLTSKVTWINAQKQDMNLTYKGFERNDRFIEIMKSFLKQKR